MDRGRLVVLGEPGAGKTVLAIKLVRGLAAAVWNAPDDARSVPLVPVRLSLPSFDPGGDLDTVAAEVIAARLDGWLIQHLVTVFGLPGKLAHALVTEGRILPVLDGLDEMDIDDTRPRRAAVVIRALNHPSAGGLRPIVITCRTSRYQQLSRPPDSADDAWPAGPETSANANADRREVVQDATVVGVEPLTVQRVVDYLTYRFPDPSDPTRIEPRWRPIVDRLTAGSSGEPLVTALSSPLRLFLTVTSYRHDASRPDELTRLDTAGQIDDHLFSRLVPAVLACTSQTTTGAPAPRRARTCACSAGSGPVTTSTVPIPGWTFRLSGTRRSDGAGVASKPGQADVDPFFVEGDGFLVVVLIGPVLDGEVAPAAPRTIGDEQVEQVLVDTLESNSTDSSATIA